MKNILFGLLATILFSSLSSAQTLMSDEEHRTMMNTFRTNLNNILTQSCPPGVSVDEYKIGITNGYYVLPQSAFILYSYANQLRDYGDQFIIKNHLQGGDYNRSYFYGVFPPSTTVENGQLVGGFTPSGMWNCALGVLDPYNCCPTILVSDQSDLNTIATTMINELTKKASWGYGVLIRMGEFSECLSNMAYSFTGTNGLFSYIESFHLNNNNDTQCVNNILIFPSWQKYHETIDILDNMVEADCDKFDMTTLSTITDDQYDNLAETVNFDEDNTLKDFEDNFAFCSLRKTIVVEESNWLAQQGDGDWDENTDPDNHFIDDDTERSLLSSRAEVIVKDSRGHNVYYKFLDDVGNWIEVRDDDIVAMAQVSQGNIPYGNPNVVQVNGRVEESGGLCNYSAKERKYEESGDNRLKRVSKVRAAWGLDNTKTPNESIVASKIFAKTKGYKKKAGIWRNARTWVTAGINGPTVQDTGFVYVDCDYEKEMKKIKEKKRKRVKVKEVSTTLIPIIGSPLRSDFGLKDNKVFSYHKKEGLIFNIDFYDISD